MNTKNRLLMGFGIPLALFSAYNAISNFSTYLDIDKRIEKPIAIAGSTATAKKTEGIQSMEEMLEEAYVNTKSRQGENTSIFFNTKLFSMDNLSKIIKDAQKHAHDIGILDQAYKTGEVPINAPNWVKLTYNNTIPAKTDSLPLRRLYSSELAQTVASVYEAFNDAVSGGVNAKGEKVSQTNMALVDQMDKASTYAFWSPMDVDFKPMTNVWANTYFSLIYSNMGKLDVAIDYLQKAKSLIDNYDDSIDLTIFRSNIKTLEIGSLKKSIKSGIYEFTQLNDMSPELKYTSGWWGQVQKKSESLGSSNVFIGDIADRCGGKRGTAALLWLIPLVGGALMGGSGYLNKND